MLIIIMALCVAAMFVVPVATPAMAPAAMVLYHSGIAGALVVCLCALVRSTARSRRTLYVYLRCRKHGTAHSVRPIKRYLSSFLNGPKITNKRILQCAQSLQTQLMGTAGAAPCGDPPQSLQLPVVKGGYTKIPNDILRDGSFSPYAKVVLGIILSYGATSCPAISTIAGQAACSARKVQSCIRELKDAGIIAVLPPGGSGNPYNTNLYVYRGCRNNQSAGEIYTSPDEVRMISTDPGNAACDDCILPQSDKAFAADAGMHQSNNPSASAWKAYGPHHNVMLTDAQYSALSADLPDLDSRIEALSQWMSEKGVAHLDYEAQLRRWQCRKHHSIVAKRPPIDDADYTNRGDSL